MATSNSALGFSSKRGSVGVGMTPELSPPPAYDSLGSLPELPAGGMAFALPPPAIGWPAEQKQQQQSLLSAAAPSLNGALADDENSRTVILYVGRISWEKNLRLLIEAFKQLPSSVRARAKLVFVGDGPARADLTKLCNKHQLDAAFMGHQKGSRLAAMYASSSVFAFPSFTETFGQVVLEALASGLPVVGLHAEGTSDLVAHGKSGFLLDINAAVQQQQQSDASASQRSTTVAKASADSASNFADALSSPQMHAAGIKPTASPRSMSLSNVHNPQSSGENGLPTPIPTVIEFAHAMQPSTPAFKQCAKSYSMLLERLILNRPVRAAMGQRAQQYASNKTWWDAMESVVLNYEEVIRRRGVKNLNDEELEALRSVQVQKAALTGPVIKAVIAVYLVLFALLLLRLW